MIGVKCIAIEVWVLRRAAGWYTAGRRVVWVLFPLTAIVLCLRDFEPASSCLDEPIRHTSTCFRYGFSTHSYLTLPRIIVCNGLRTVTDVLPWLGSTSGQVNLLECIRRHF